MVKHVTARHPLPPRPKKEREKNNTAAVKKFNRYKLFAGGIKKFVKFADFHKQVLVSIFFVKMSPTLAALGIDHTERAPRQICLPTSLVPNRHVN